MGVVYAPPPPHPPLRNTARPLDFSGIRMSRTIRCESVRQPVHPCFTIMCCNIPTMKYYNGIILFILSAIAAVATAEDVNVTVTDGDPCTEVLRPGDVMVVALSSDDPNLVALVALEQIPKGVNLFLTDSAWDGSGFLENDGEGTLILNLTDTIIPKGTVFGYGRSDLVHGDEWELVEGNFSLSTAGDNVFVFCVTSEGNLNHLGAFSYVGDWLEQGLAEDDYGTASSSLPDDLQSFGETTLFHADNYVYRGPTRGNKDDIQKHLERQSYWIGLNALDGPLQVPEDFCVDGIGNCDASEDSSAFEIALAATLQMSWLLVACIYLYLNY